jgi:hypothetical protein
VYRCSAIEMAAMTSPEISGTIAGCTSGLFFFGLKRDFIFIEYNLTILRKLGVTKHIYTKDDKYILKHTHWFLMTCTDNGEPVPQTEEDIQIVKWFDKDKSLECINNTYDSIKDFLLEIDIDNLFL